MRNGGRNESGDHVNRRGKLRPSHVFSFVAGGLLMLAIGNIFWRHYAKPTTKVQALAQPIQARATAPWGNLEETSFALERPDEYLHQREPSEEIRWFFDGVSRSQLIELIRTSGFTEQQQASLLDESRWQTSSNGIVVRPELNVVRDIPEASRQRLYSVLAQSPENLLQRFPFTFRGTAEDLLAGTGLPEARLHDFEKMIYHQGDVSLFADLRCLQLTCSKEEVESLIRRLTRVQSLFVNLRIDERSDVPSLIQYWARAERRADVKLLLESMARVPGGTSVNVSQFMPPLPRSLLYSFPHAEGPALSPPNLDCVWSSMNFFNKQPDNRFLNPAFVAQVLDSQYHPVSKPESFGDIIMFYKAEPSGQAKLVHMCVFIADDVVFTKNGGDIYQPWVLMRLPDVRALFANQPGLQTAFFRSNAGS